jgi:hypothetical protein
MKFANIIWLSLFLSAIALSACSAGATPAPTEDPGAVQTQAFQTVVAQFGQQQTQTAEAIPPTQTPTLAPLATATAGTAPTFASVGGTSTVIATGVGTPFAFNTPAAGFTAVASAVPTQSELACNNSEFIADITIPDGSEVHPGNNFTKVWEIKNTGTCTWDDGYALVYQGGVFDGYDVAISSSRDFVEPGEIHRFEVELSAPLKDGEATDCWKMRGDDGYYFGTYLCVTVIVD